MKAANKIQNDQRMGLCRLQYQLHRGICFKGICRGWRIRIDLPAYYPRDNSCLLFYLEKILPAAGSTQ